MYTITSPKVVFSNFNIIQVLVGVYAKFAALECCNINLDFFLWYSYAGDMTYDRLNHALTGGTHTTDNLYGEPWDPAWRPRSGS